MTRIAAIAFILGYLALLTYGTGSHILGYRTHDRPGMYFIVWDMYCGWDAYETRRHLVAEGVSGQCYDLAPAPWGEFTPFGSAGRGDLDYMGNYSGAIARNVLLHTEHEDIARVYLVDECWPKKYNLPESLWKRRYEEPYQRVTYHYIRATYLPDGEVLQIEPDWKNFLATEALRDNPRLREEVAAGQPFMPTLGRPGSQVNSPAYLPAEPLSAVAKAQ